MPVVVPPFVVTKKLSTCHVVRRCGYCAIIIYLKALSLISLLVCLLLATPQLLHTRIHCKTDERSASTCHTSASACFCCSSRAMASTTSCSVCCQRVCKHLDSSKRTCKRLERHGRRSNGPITFCQELEAASVNRLSPAYNVLHAKYQNVKAKRNVYPGQKEAKKIEADSTIDLEHVLGQLQRRLACFWRWRRPHVEALFTALLDLLEHVQLRYDTQENVLDRCRGR